MKLNKIYVHNYLHIADEEYLQVSKDITVLIGPNGSGKSNLMRLIASMEDPIESSKRTEITLPGKIEYLFSGSPFSIGINNLSKLESVQKRYANPFFMKLVSFVKFVDEIKGRYIEANRGSIPTDQQVQAKQQAEAAKKDLENITKSSSEVNQIFITTSGQDADVKILREGNSITFSFEGIRKELENELLAIKEKIDNGGKGDSKPLRYVHQTYGDFVSWASSRLKKHAIVGNCEVKKSVDEKLFTLVLLEQEKLIMQQNPSADSLRLELDAISQENDQVQKAIEIDKRIRSIIEEWDLPNLKGYLFNVNLHKEYCNVTFKSEQDEVMLPLSEGNSGLRWLFVLIINILRNSVNSPPDLILIDEPGNALHPSTQKSIVTAFEALSKKSQLIYSTHSIFMLNPNRILDLRVVTRGNQGTKIENKPYKEKFSIINQSLGTNVLYPYFILEKAAQVVFLEGPADVVILVGLSQIMFAVQKTCLDLTRTAIHGIQNTGEAIEEAKQLLKWTETITSVFVGDNDKNGLAIIKKFQKKLTSTKAIAIHEITAGFGCTSMEFEDLIPAEYYMKAFEIVHPETIKEEDKKKIACPIVDSIESNIGKGKLNKPQVARTAIELMLADVGLGALDHISAQYWDAWNSMFEWIKNNLETSK